MIKIIKQKQNVMYYECDCGTKGICSFKPMDEDTVIVVDIRCPTCKTIERITILQYKDNISKQKLMDNFNDIDMSWVLSVNEELLEAGE